jgi:hypothetical protein
MEVPMLVIMWKAVGTQRDTSDPAFVSWHVTAEDDDGRERPVMVKIEALAVAGTSWTPPKVLCAMCGTRW